MTMSMKLELTGSGPVVSATPHRPQRPVLQNRSNSVPACREPVVHSVSTIKGLLCQALSQVVFAPLGDIFGASPPLAELKLCGTGTLCLRLGSKRTRITNQQARWQVRQGSL
jgi:hypothetical protein